ncbi:MAG: TonB-dependent receptor [Prevotella sp.]|nr:TonB-dependent receptor [Prevotella sp.]
MNRQWALIGAILLASGLTGSSYTMATPPTQSQSVTQSSTIIKGQIVDAEGEPILGATVVELGTTRGTVTDIDGNFTINSHANAKLRITYVGYKTVETKAVNGMKVVMQNDNAQLDEIVVVGYGQQKKVNLTGSVTNVDIEKTLGGRPEQDVAKALQGAVPGLTITNTSGDINSQPTMQIRGLGTLSNGATSNPLVVVDGVPVDDLTMVNAADIATISVLKDAASTSIYGSRAAFGVILITTKEGKKGEKVSVKYDGHFAWDRATVLPDYPDVPSQLEAAMIGAKRTDGSDPELFGMYFSKMLPYAKAWKEQHSGKKGYSEMKPFQSMDNVGDYYFNGNQPFYYADYDIQDIWYNKAAPSQSHSVSLNGSSGRTSYYTSFSYDYKQNLMKFNPDKLSRYNFTTNLKTDVTDWLTVGTRVNFVRRSFSKADSWNNVYQYLWRWGSFFIPSGYMYDENGEKLDYRVVAMQKQAARKTTVHDQARFNAYAIAHITKDLTFNVDYTYQIDNYNYKTSDHSVYGMNWSGVTPTYIVGTSSSNTTRENIKQNRWTANAYLNYNHTWVDAHNLGVLVGVNGERFKSDEMWANRTHLYNEDYPELNLAYGEMKDATISSFTGDRSTAGYFGRINYDYKGIYLLELNGRYDGSSRFPAGDKWAFFPSMSLGYRFTEEGYWKNLHDVISNGKLRFSYGEIGNEAIGDNMYISTISPVGQSSLYWMDKNGNKLNQFQLPDWVSSSLTWERIKTTDIGVDLSFLNDDLSLTFDWYQRTTNDMLAPGKAIPDVAGASAPFTNAGSLRTRGWELSLSYRKQINKDLNVYGTFNIGDSKSKVTKWNNDSKLIGHTGGIVSASNARMYAYEGETWGDIWGFETDRYFTEDDFNGKDANGKWIYKDGVADQTGIQTDNFVFGPGDIKYKDLDGNHVIDGGKGTADDHGDLKVIGNTLPRYEYSFHLGGSWKGIDLDLFFQGVGKRDMWTQSSFVFPLMRDADKALYANQTNYNVYDPANGIINISQSNRYPCLYSGNEGSGNVTGLASIGGEHNYYPQTKYLVNMAYLRLKNVTIGYTLPASITKKVYMEKVRFYGSVNNLCLLYNGAKDYPVDPEMNAGQGSLSYGTWGRTFPITRTWSVGVQVTF